MDLDLATLKQYSTFANSLAHDAGVILQRQFSTNYTITTKADGSILTSTDTLINNLVIERIHSKYPQHSIRGEEASLAVAASGLTWICDPIDGTLPFSLGIPTNVFSLALADHAGRIILAVVEDPYSRRRYSAILSGSSFENNDRVQVNDCSSLKNAYIGSSGIGSPYVDITKLNSYLRSEAQRTIACNSIIYEAMLVANGRLAGALYLGTAAHDIASAKLIVENAGGKVTDLFGQQQSFLGPLRGAVISNGLIHEELIQLVGQCEVD